MFLPLMHDGLGITNDAKSINRDAYTTDLASQASDAKGRKQKNQKKTRALWGGKATLIPKMMGRGRRLYPLSLS